MTRSIIELKAKPDGANLFKELRAERPVYFDENIRMYVVSRYEDIVEVFSKPNLFSSAFSLFHYKYEEIVTGILETEAYGALERVLPMTDPPDHTRIRAMVERLFFAPRIAKIQDHVKAVTKELIDSFIDDGKAEIVSQLAIPVPVAVIGDMLSLPRERMSDIKKWTYAYTTCAGNIVRDEKEAVQLGHDLAEMQNYIVARLDEYRANPGDNLLTELLNARSGTYEPFTDKEILAVIATFLGAGHETSSAAITSAVKMLAMNPDVVDTLHAAEDKDAAYKLLVEEVLRLEPPVNNLPRVTTADTELGGVKIPQGSPLVVFMAAANRDEKMFGDTADEFEPNRKNAMRHLAFGGGVHACLGSVLARLELKCVLSALIERIDNLRLVNPNIGLSDYAPLIMELNLKLKKLEIVFDKRK